MKDIEKTVNAFSKRVSLPMEKIGGGYNDSSSCSNPKKIFSMAKQGSVNKTKAQYEQISTESKFFTPPPGPKSRCTTPFTKVRSPTPVSEQKKRTYSMIPNSDASDATSSFRGRTGTGTKMSLRKRSPSPIITGKVSTFRSKFESIPTKSECTNSSTIPRTTRLKSREP